MKKYSSLKTMSDEDKIRTVKDIFSSITDRYDFLNRLLSLRRDVAWRRTTVKKMHFFNTNRMLDVATGTADLAIETIRYYSTVKVTGIDFVQEMVDKGMEKVNDFNLGDYVKLQWGDATNLDFPEDNFDVSAIAFGIRNIPDKEKALSEMLRVVVPGGQVLILELTTPGSGLWRSTYSSYLNGILPKLAKLFTQNSSAYDYLADSIINFPTRQEFLELMESIGLGDCRAISLTFGVCTLYIGKKKHE